MKKQYRRPPREHGVGSVLDQYERSKFSRTSENPPDDFLPLPPWFWTARNPAPRWLLFYAPLRRGASCRAEFRSQAFEELVRFAAARLQGEKLGGHEGEGEAPALAGSEFESTIEGAIEGAIEGMSESESGRDSWRGKVLDYAIARRVDTVELATTTALLFAIGVSPLSGDPATRGLLREWDLEASRLWKLGHVLAPLNQVYRAWMDPFLLSRAMAIFGAFARDVVADLRALKERLPGLERELGVDKHAVGELAVVLLYVSLWRTTAKTVHPSLEELCETMAVDFDRAVRIRTRLLTTYFLQEARTDWIRAQYNFK